MRKNLKAFVTITAAAALCVSTAFTSLAAWQQDNTGWWYQNEDGSYPKSQWFQDTDGKWYYFGSNGYMLKNTSSPDGYQLGEDGTWNGSTQKVYTKTQEVEIPIDVNAGIDNPVGPTTTERKSGKEVAITPLSTTETITAASLAEHVIADYNANDGQGGQYLYDMTGVNMGSLVIGGLLKDTRKAIIAKGLEVPTGTYNNEEGNWISFTLKDRK